ncbi:hypothetical protein Tco_1371048 [Tanacetum coccineum]
MHIRNVPIFLLERIEWELPNGAHVTGLATRVLDRCEINLSGMWKTVVTCAKRVEFLLADTFELGYTEMMFCRVPVSFPLTSSPLRTIRISLREGNTEQSPYPTVPGQMAYPLRYALHRPGTAVLPPILLLLVLIVAGKIIILSCSFLPDVRMRHGSYPPLTSFAIFLILTLGRIYQSSFFFSGCPWHGIANFWSGGLTWEFPPCLHFKGIQSKLSFAEQLGAGLGSETLRS